ncbi:MAG: hypothetical protein LBP59_05010 [Planctomycetaceae bacterium]|nr:hypothetical protein [Planctomycetaceae bacterium]
MSEVTFQQPLGISKNSFFCKKVMRRFNETPPTWTNEFLETPSYNFFVSSGAKYNVKI